ncbi:hypothetical protein DSO57_1014838 [Entomophthora muscae]|uniref:Uncharacterized protein n=1 Tax=Entomophthora muscae TaxID=34485 RepID=A0ACC2S7Q7_9FUNG|nr:hypothetical protein DSO57_1014838 [Entomophthora muscae]
MNLKLFAVIVTFASTAVLEEPKNSQLVSRDSLPKPSWLDAFKDIFAGGRSPGFKPLVP